MELLIHLPLIKLTLAGVKTGLQLDAAYNLQLTITCKDTTPLQLNFKSATFIQVIKCASSNLNVIKKRCPTGCKIC